MAVTTTITDLGKIANIGWKVKLVTATLDNAYPTNGWPITVAKCGMEQKVKIFAPMGYGYPLKPVVQSDGSILLLCYKALGTEQDNNASGHNGHILHCLVIGF